MQLELAPAVERRKQVRLKVRADLITTEQRYEGKRHYVVKDPVSLRYYRFNEQEYFVFKHFDGKHTMEETQKAFEAEYRPQRLTHEDLEAFARQLLTAGLVQHQSNRAADELLDSRKKQRRMQRLATLTNILYIKIPIIDPDRVLTFMASWLKWIFTRAFLAVSVALMLSAVLQVVIHYNTFYDKLPEYHEFFQYQTVLYMWISLGIVKVIHEFGHGLSCKAFGGECHEMGFLLMCLSPALYCNVSDSWTLASKWKRIIISFAGIYVELIIAAIATWVWWYTPGEPEVNRIAMCLMTLCSISTFVFNANPLMRFDGYYIMADWLEIPNLRDRCNKYLKNQFCEFCLGMEVQPEPYMALNRKILFITYAVASYIYRWVITFSIIYTISKFLEPYKLGSLSRILALAAAASMLGWPLYRMLKGLRQRGRLPDMKKNRVTATAVVVFLLVLAFFLLPLPVSRIREKGLMEVDSDPAVSQKVYLPPGVGSTLEDVFVTDGQWVDKGSLLMRFRNLELEYKRKESTEAKKELLATADELGDAARKAAEPMTQKNLQAQAIDCLSKAEAAEQQARAFDLQISALDVRAPLAGRVISPPKREAIGRSYDDPQHTRPLCQIALTDHLKVILPLEPHNYQLLKEELARAAARHGEAAALTAWVRVPGRGTQLWQGRVTQASLPLSDAKVVPPQLTFKGGGSLATKPADSSGQLVPQSQVYLVEVEVLNPDPTICPGTQPRVQINCSWRSGAWWVWRRIHVMMDPSL